MPSSLPISRFDRMAQRVVPPLTKRPVRQLGNDPIVRDRPLRLERKTSRAKRPKPRKHYAVLISWRLKSFGCPSCGPLGDVFAGIAHCVANQYTVSPEEGR